MRQLFTALIILLLSATVLLSATINVNPGDDLIAAMNSANAGDNVVVANGTYVLPSTLNIAKDGITLTGESEAGVILDVSGHGGYGIYTTASNLVLENFTMIPQSASGNAYPIKASFGGTVQNGLLMQNISIDGSYRTAFDIHAIDNVTLVNLTAKNSSWGNGISLTGVHNATVTGCTTSNNAWGSLAVYCSQPAYANRGSDNITIDFNSNNFASEVYKEDQFGLINTNITILGATHLIENEYAADASMYMYTDKGEAEALSIADAFHTKYSNTKSTVQEVSSGDYIVDPNLKIQEAIDAASAGGQVELTAGTFTEDFTIDKHVDLTGRGVDTSILNSLVDLTGSGAGSADPLVIENFTANGLTQNSDIFEITSGATVRYLTMQNIKTVGVGNLVGESAAIWVRNDASLRDASIHSCTFQASSYGIYTQKASGGIGVVEDVSISGCTFQNNTGKGIYAEKLTRVSISGCTFLNNGDPGYWHGTWNAGVDINLKYGSYSDILVKGNTFTGNGVCSTEGVALTVKARDDGGYSGNPAILDGVTITENSFDGNERAIRIGEPGKNNASPINVVISNNDFLGNIGCSTGGSPIADVLNYTQTDLTADANWWGDPAGPTPDQIVENPGLVQVDTWLTEPGGTDIFKKFATLTVYVWYDADEDGLADTDEKGLKGIHVRLPKDVKTTKHLTNARGKCVFNHLLPETYTVLIDPTLLPAGTVCTNGEMEREVTVSATNNFAEVWFGLAGDDLDEWTGQDVHQRPQSDGPDPDPNTLVFVEGSPSGGLGKYSMDWHNAVDKDVEGSDGTVWAWADESTGDDVPWAIFEFYDRNIYAFDYALFQTDNGTDDNQSGHVAYQARKIQVLVSTTGKEMEDFEVVGTFKRKYGKHKMQWCTLGQMVEARYVKLRLLTPVVEGKRTQIVEFDVNTSDKKGPVAVAASEETTVAQIPTEELLLNNYPNPFNPTTTISFRLETESNVTLRVYDITGKQVAELVNGYRRSGRHQVTFDASDLTSGVYFYHLQAGSMTEMKRMLLIK